MDHGELYAPLCRSGDGRTRFSCSDVWGGTYEPVIVLVGESKMLSSFTTGRILWRLLDAEISCLGSSGVRLSFVDQVSVFKQMDCLNRLQHYRERRWSSVYRLGRCCPSDGCCEYWIQSHVLCHARTNVVRVLFNTSRCKDRCCLNSAIYVAILISSAVVCSLGTRVLARLQTFYVICNILYVFAQSSSLYSQCSRLGCAWSSSLLCRLPLQRNSETRRTLLLEDL